MQKVLILSKVAGGQIVAQLEHPRVLLTGLPTEALNLVQGNVFDEMAAAGAVNSTAEQLGVMVVTVEDEVTVGDTLDLVSSVYQKHV